MIQNDPDAVAYLEDRFDEVMAAREYIEAHHRARVERLRQTARGGPITVHPSDPDPKLERAHAVIAEVLGDPTTGMVRRRMFEFISFPAEVLNADSARWPVPYDIDALGPRDDIRRRD